MCNIWLGLIYPDYSVGLIVVTEQLRSSKYFKFFFIEPRKQCIRSESYSSSFACQFALRQKLLDDIKVYG